MALAASRGRYSWHYSNVPLLPMGAYTVALSVLREASSAAFWEPLSAPQRERRGRARCAGLRWRSVLRADKARRGGRQMANTVGEKTDELRGGRVNEIQLSD